MTEREMRVHAYYMSNGMDRYMKFVTAPTDEATLLKNVKEMLSLMGALIVRESAATKRGVSDLLVCYRGRFVAIETKDNTGVPSPHQCKFILKVREAGGVADVVQTVEQAFRLLLDAVREQ